MSGSSRAKRLAKEKRRAVKNAARQRERRDAIKKRTTSTVQLHALPGRLMLVALRGLLAHPSRALCQIDHSKLAGALEDVQDLREIVYQTGIAVLAALLDYPIGTEGATVKGLLDALVSYAGVDVEAMKAAALKEAEEEAKLELEEAAALAEAEMEKQARLDAERLAAAQNEESKEEAVP